VESYSELSGSSSERILHPGERLNREPTPQIWNKELRRHAESNRKTRRPVLKGHARFNKQPDVAVTRFGDSYLKARAYSLLAVLVRISEQVRPDCRITQIIGEFGKTTIPDSVPGDALESSTDCPLSSGYARIKQKQ
jgi:hypothetical protein